VVRGTDVEIPVGATCVRGILTVPAGARGLVLFAHGSGSGRHSPRNGRLADVLVEAGLATLLFDLLTAREAENRANVFDVGLLAERLVDATGWTRDEPGLAHLPLGFFGASTGAAAALAAAATLQGSGGPHVAAVVCRGGRPDLAADALDRVQAPTLLVVGSADEEVLALNRAALQRLGGEARLEVVPGATHLFEEPGALDAVAVLARDWLLQRLPR
jgi:putative phosphoribosyl transferase